MTTRPPLHSPSRRWTILGVLCLPLLVTVVAATVLNVALPELTEKLHPSAVQSLWIVDGYSLVLAGLLVAGGTLADRVGRKRTLLIGCGLFGLVSLGGALAGSAGELIAVRALLGVSAAVIMPSTLSILRNVFTDQRELGRAIAVWTAVGAAGAAAGPIAGGLLVEHFGWQAALWSAAPVTALCLPLVALLVPESHGYREGRWDIPSVLLSLGGIIGVVYAVKDTEHGVRATTLAALAAGTLLLTLFVRRQRRLTHPLLDLTLFTDRRFTVGALCVLLGMFVQFGPMYFLSQRFQLIQGYGPMTAGIALAPMMLAVLLATSLTNRLMPRIGLRGTLVTGFATAVAGLLVLAAAPASAGYWPLGLGLAVLGLGAGMAVIAATTTLMQVAPPERAGGAAAVQETGYELGAALGVAVLGSLMNLVYRAGMTDLPGVPESAQHSAHDSITAATQAAATLNSTSGATLLDHAQNAFLGGLTIIHLVCACALALAAVAAHTVLRKAPEIKPDALAPTH
ncbi:MFS transporter [Streptomyces fuscichromogenes]|uniref:MFS transporter n=1 Tax=Streptomyces fuscichromogenes TaxID=1324013 RepID=UPI003804A250